MTRHSSFIIRHSRPAAVFILLALLLILSLRMTMSETLLEPLSQIAARLADQSSPKPANIRIAGPAYTAGFALATTLLAALAALLAALTKSLSPARLGKFLLIALILALALYSTFHAANRFTALIGTTDLATALLAAWAISLLCHGQLLGDRGRQFIIAALLALLAAWIAKGFYQYFIDFPDTIAFYHEHKLQQLLENGINPDNPYQVQLFESRLNAREVSIFFNLSNVAAAALIALLTLLAALLTVTFKVPTSAPPAPLKSKIENRKSKIKNELPLTLILQILTALLLLAGLLIALLTKSRGGAILSILCSLLAIPLIRFNQQFSKHRKKILTAAAALIILTTAVLLSYGLTHNALPSKSLTFRWHYWTAAAHLIHQHPALGVGLNNFGEFYTSVKRPSSPEDVTDPHSFFIRLAAELGLPATLLLTLLLLWTTKSAIFTPKPDKLPPALDTALHKIPSSPPHLVTLSLLSLLFWILHYLLAEPPAEYFLILTILYAILTTLAAAMFLYLLTPLTPAALRTLTLAVLLGALGMLAYDQINMALVTGPVAMLFWTLLALADYQTPSPSSPPHSSFVIRHSSFLPALALTAATLALACYLWLPLLHNTMPLNPLPAETRFIQAANQSPPNNPAALAALNQALALDPRNLELLNTRIAIKLRLHRPVAADIRHLLTLDTANAPIRIQLASLNSDLTPAARIQILNQALHLNDQLPPDEPKRLPPPEITRIQNLIQALKPNITLP